WDMQVGSDGRVACATCHFHAGADHRAQNELSNPSGSFPLNYTLTLADFPFHQLADVTDNRSSVVRDTGQRTGSAGVARRPLVDASTSISGDDGTDSDAPAFNLSGLHLRQVTARNSPSVIDAVFNARNFWDGRASDIFSGRTPFGASDPAANSLVYRDAKLA